MTNKIKFLTQDLEEAAENEAEVCELITEKSIDIMNGIKAEIEESDENEISLLFAYVIEFISAILVKTDALDERITHLEEMLED